MVVFIQYRGRVLKTLIDTGATSNFINFRVIKYFNLQPTKATNRDVLAIDGRLLVPARKGGLFTLDFTLENRNFNSSFISAPCHNYDLVLGLPFLRKESILIDPAHMRLIYPDQKPTPNQGSRIQNLELSTLKESPSQRDSNPTLNQNPRAQNLELRTKNNRKTLKTEIAQHPAIEPSINPVARKGSSFQPAYCLTEEEEELRSAQVTLIEPDIETNVKDHTENLNPDPARCNEAKEPRPIKQEIPLPIEGTDSQIKSPLSLISTKHVLSLSEGIESAYLSSTTDLDLDHLDNVQGGDEFQAIYHSRLGEGKTMLSATYAVEDSSIEIPREYQDFADVFSEGEDVPLAPYRGPGIDHEINLEPGTTPPYIRPYRQSEKEMKLSKEYTDEMLRKGFIRPSQSPCASPMVFAEKKGSDKPRPCIDYRGLNAITVKNRYPLPLIDTLIDRLRTAKYFVKLDLREAYNLIRIREGDEWKTAFITKEGLFEYLVMPFGMSNAPATFQSYIDRALQGLSDTELIAFIDDILIYGDTVEEVQQRTHRCLQRLREYGLYVKLKKCMFDVTEVPFLGYIIGKGGITMDTKRVDTIVQWPRPMKVKEVQSFLGFCNFYRRFIYQYSKVAAALTNLTKKEGRFEWTAQAEGAFQALKGAFTKHLMLKHFDPNLPCYIYTDASGYAISGVLCQKYDGILHPVAFYSRKMDTAERNYGTPDQELLAIVKSMKHWRHYLEGALHQVTVYSDHANLQRFRTKTDLSRRQVRWAEDLQRYDFIIQHCPGKANPADGPSRRIDYLLDDGGQSPSTQPFLYLAATIIRDDLQPLLKEAYETDAFVSKLMAKPLGEPWAKEEDILYYGDKVYVPERLRIQVLEENHDAPMAGHFGQDRTLELIKRTYYWPAMQDSVRTYIQGCQECQRNKPNNHTTFGLLAPLPPPVKPWTRIGMDMITDLPTTKNGFDCIMVFIDAFSKMSHFVPCKKTLNSITAAEMLRKEVIKHHGIPSVIISDRDKRWINKFWKELSDRLKIKQSPSSAYHPQTDGQTERVNPVLEAYLRSFINYEQDNWDEWLDQAEFAYNNSRHAATGTTPFFAVYGYHPNHEFKAQDDREGEVNEPAAALHAERMKDLHETMYQNLEKAQRRMTKYYNAHRKDHSFAEGDKVWLRTTNIRTQRECKKLDRKKLGPFKITKVIGPQAYRLDLPETMKIHNVFHVSLLEPAREPVPGQANPTTEPLLIDGETEWEVQEIVNSARDRRLGFVYEVRWIDGSTTWEPPYHLAHSPEFVNAFHLLHPTKPKPRPHELRTRR